MITLLACDDDEPWGSVTYTAPGKAHPGGAAGPEHRVATPLRLPLGLRIAGGGRAGGRAAPSRLGVC
jgi:hypothetical protein